MQFESVSVYAMLPAENMTVAAPRNASRWEHFIVATMAADVAVVGVGSQRLLSNGPLPVVPVLQE